jgi:hypothetical protein
VTHVTRAGPFEAVAREQILGYYTDIIVDPCASGAKETVLKSGDIPKRLSGASEGGQGKLSSPLNSTSGHFRPFASHQFYGLDSVRLNGKPANIVPMWNLITRKTIALAIQLAGIVLLAATAMTGLQHDTILLQMGAFTFVVGCYLEARAQTRPSAGTELQGDLAEPFLPEFHPFL